MDNDELIAAMDAHDESLLRHIDAKGELSCAAATVIGRVAKNLLRDRLQWPAVTATEWYALASAFVTTYGTQALDDARLGASLGQDVPEVTAGDRLFLQQLVVPLDRYLDVRSAGD